MGVLAAQSAPFTTVKTEFLAITGSKSGASILYLLQNIHLSNTAIEQDKARRGNYQRAQGWAVQKWTQNQIANLTGVSRDYVGDALRLLRKLKLINLEIWAEGNRARGFEIVVNMERIETAISKYHNIALTIAHNRQARDGRKQTDRITLNDYRDAVKAYAKTDRETVPTEARNTDLFTATGEPRFFCVSYPMRQNSPNDAAILPHKIDYSKDESVFFQKKEEKKEKAGDFEGQEITMFSRETDAENAFAGEKKKRGGEGAALAQTNIIHMDAEETRVYAMDFKNGVTETGLVAKMCADMIQFYRENPLKLAEVREKLKKEDIYDAATGNNELLRENIERLLTDYLNWFLKSQYRKHTGTRARFKITTKLNSLDFGFMWSLSWENRARRVKKPKTDKKVKQKDAATPVYKQNFQTSKQNVENMDKKVNISVEDATPAKKQIPLPFDPSKVITSDEYKRGVMQELKQTESDSETTQQEKQTDPKEKEKLDNLIWAIQHVNAVLDEKEAANKAVLDALQLKNHTKEIERMKQRTASALWLWESCTDDSHKAELKTRFEAAKEAEKQCIDRYKLN